MESITEINTQCDSLFLKHYIQQSITALAQQEHKPEWVKQMEVAMELIGTACNSNHKWADCADCPFDAFCTAINDAYWDHRWHDMHDTFCKNNS